MKHKFGKFLYGPVDIIERNTDLIRRASNFRDRHDHFVWFQRFTIDSYRRIFTSCRNANKIYNI